MHGRTRSKRRRPRAQIIIENFFFQGEKERDGGWRERLLASFESREDLVLSGFKMCGGSGSLSFVI